MGRRRGLSRLLSIAILLLPGSLVRAQQGQPPEPSARLAEASAAKPERQGGSKVVEEGLFPKSFRIPGTDLSFAIGGFVKVDFIQDFSGIGEPYEFKTNTIPVDGTPPEEFAFEAFPGFANGIYVG